MNSTQSTTPILLVVFNRPEATQRVIESIREVRPQALYVAADGPRSNTPGDAERCAAARKVATSVDWSCEVHTLLHNENLGCAANTSSGITWFFESVPEGIILEDDCVPDASFYRFCQELLQYYRDVPRIMHIAGNSHQYGRRRGLASYYFSKYANFWGWATWRRAWSLFDPDLRPSWELKDDWSAPWQLSIERSRGIAIVPNVNLVKNIGFGAGATHTKAVERGAFAEATEIPFPLVHPRSLTVNRSADIFTYYAHHRLVRHLRFIWMYRLMDYVYVRLKAVKRLFLRLINGGGRSATLRRR
jgi:glycosyltransferase involved in cell wall biosynthesis